MMAYERGNRKELGHPQGIARLKTHEQLLDKIRRWVKVALLLTAGQFKCKIGLSLFTGQTWEFMGGRLCPEGHGQAALLVPHVSAY